MAKAKFQDTLKSGLTGVATVGKKNCAYSRRRGCCCNQQGQGTA